MKSVLVTGGTGYIGSRLISRLIKDGARVHALFRGNANAPAFAGLPSGARAHAYDGTMDRMLKIMAKAKPQAVFHLAARVTAPHRPKDVGDLLVSNVELGLQLAEAASASGVGYFINTGTFWQRQSGNGYRPNTLYAATKQAFDDLLAYYAAQTSLATATLLLYDVYGPTDSRDKLLVQLEAARRRGKTLDLSPGKQLVDFVHVDDVVEAYLAAAKMLERSPRLSGRVWAVGSGRPVSLRRLVALYEQCAGPVKVRWGGRPYRPFEVFKPWKGPRVPGWRPRIGLKDGLRRALLEAR